MREGFKINLRGLSMKILLKINFKYNFGCEEKTEKYQTNHFFEDE